MMYAYSLLRISAIMLLYTKETVLNKMF